VRGVKGNQQLQVQGEPQQIVAKGRYEKNPEKGTKKESLGANEVAVTIRTGNKQENRIELGTKTFAKKKKKGVAEKQWERLYLHTQGSPSRKKKKNNRKEVEKKNFKMAGPRLKAERGGGGGGRKTRNTNDPNNNLATQKWLNRLKGREKGGKRSFGIKSGGF